MLTPCLEEQIDFFLIGSDVAGQAVTRRRRFALIGEPGASQRPSYPERSLGPAWPHTRFRRHGDRAQVPRSSDRTSCPAFDGLFGVTSKLVVATPLTPLAAVARDPDMPVFRRRPAANVTLVRRTSYPR